MRQYISENPSMKDSFTRMKIIENKGSRSKLQDMCQTSNEKLNTEQLLLFFKGLKIGKPFEIQKLPQLSQELV